MPVRRWNAPLALLTLLAAAPLFPDYPEIRELNGGDLLFRQLQEDVQAFYRFTARQPAARRGGGPPGAGLEADRLPALKLFTYRPRPQDDLFSLAARLNLTYDTLCSLNGLDHPQALRQRRTVLVSNRPGVFVSRQPEGDFQQILFHLRSGRWREAQPLQIQRAGGPKPFLFFPGEYLHEVERAYFLQVLFRFPVRAGDLSSGYGMREDPFTGRPHFHDGIDIVAPPGSEVLAARGGVAASVGTDPVLGNFIQLHHEGGYVTVYGHLEHIRVSLKDKVTSGMIIGTVGSTGLSTGPHLHFAIRRQGGSQNPVPLFPGGKD